MFDGKTETRRAVNVGSRGKPGVAGKNKNVKDFISDTKKLREERAAERQRATASTTIQSVVRSWLVRKKFFASMRVVLDKKLADISNLQAIFKKSGNNFIVPVDIVTALTRQLNFFYTEEKDRNRMKSVSNMLSALLTAPAQQHLLFSSFSKCHVNLSIYSKENQSLYLLKTVLTALIDTCYNGNGSPKKITVAADVGQDSLAAELLLLLKGIASVVARVPGISDLPGSSAAAAGTGTGTNGASINDTLRLFVGLELAQPLSALLRRILLRTTSTSISADRSSISSSSSITLVMPYEQEIKAVTSALLNSCFAVRSTTRSSSSSPSSSSSAAATAAGQAEEIGAKALISRQVAAVIHTAHSLLTLPLFAQHQEMRAFLRLLDQTIPGQEDNKTFWGVILDEITDSFRSSSSSSSGDRGKKNLSPVGSLHMLGNFSMQVLQPTNSSSSSSSSISTGNGGMAGAGTGAALSSQLLLHTSSEWMSALAAMLADLQDLNVTTANSSCSNSSNSGGSAGSNRSSAPQPLPPPPPSAFAPTNKRRKGDVSPPSADFAWSKLHLLKLPLLFMMQATDNNMAAMSAQQVMESSSSYVQQHLHILGDVGHGNSSNSIGHIMNESVGGNIDNFNDRAHAEAASRNYELAAGQKKLAFRLAQIRGQFARFEQAQWKEQWQQPTATEQQGQQQKQHYISSNNKAVKKSSKQAADEAEIVAAALQFQQQVLVECIASFRYVTQVLLNKEILNRLFSNMWSSDNSAAAVKELVAGGGRGAGGPTSGNSCGGGEGRGTDSEPMEGITVPSDRSADSSSSSSTSSNGSVATRIHIQSMFQTVNVFSQLLTHSPIDESDPKDCNMTFELLNSLSFPAVGAEPVARKVYSMLESVFDIADVDTTGSSSSSRSADTTGNGIKSLLSSRLVSDETVARVASKLNLPHNWVRRSVSSALHLLCCVLYHQLSATDDKQLLEQQKVLKIDELRHLTGMLKEWLFSLYWSDPVLESQAWTFAEQSRTADLDGSESGNTSVGSGYSIRGGAPALAATVTQKRSSFIKSLIRDTSSSSGSGSGSSSGNNNYLLPLALKASTEDTSTTVDEVLLVFHSQLAATKLFNHLCVRGERRKSFLTPGLTQWGRYLPDFDISASAAGDRSLLSASVSDSMGDRDADGVDAVLKNPKAVLVLSAVPQVIPFKQRVSIFQRVLERDKTRYFSTVAAGTAGGGALAAALGLFEGPGGALQLEVHRDRIVDDAFRALNTAGHKLKGRIQVQFISEQGMPEAGIDGGGLFKEFIDTFTKAAFDPEYGMFVPTSTQLLTPNPASWVLGEHHLSLFNFVGKMLGKAVYEKILLESEFAGGFLNALLGRSNTIDDLFYLDEALYRSLMQLKQFVADGNDMESVGLFFDSTRTVYGAEVVEELVPDGSRIPVTNQNLHAYIHRLAHHKQNVETSEQCRALLAGFRELIPLQYVRMFSPHELQLVISGSQRAIDLADWQRHVHYASGYHPSQPYIQAFWQIVAEMTHEDQGNLLKFVTSCSRQPLLGFAQLQPTFCIQKVSQDDTGVSQGMGALAKLPSAATCMNLLKLPNYDSVDILREKLLYAVRSNSGFELS